MTDEFLERWIEDCKRAEAERDALKADRDLGKRMFDDLELENDALKAAIRAYVVAAARAPSNRDEAEIDAAAHGLVQALEEVEK